MESKWRQKNYSELEIKGLKFQNYTGHPSVMGTKSQATAGQDENFKEWVLTYDVKNMGIPPLCPEDFYIACILSLNQTLI